MNHPYIRDHLNIETLSLMSFDIDCQKIKKTIWIIFVGLKHSVPYVLKCWKLECDIRDAVFNSLENSE